MKMGKHSSLEVVRNGKQIHNFGCQSMSIKLKYLPKPAQEPSGTTDCHQLLHYNNPLLPYLHYQFHIFLGAPAN